MSEWGAKVEESGSGSKEVSYAGMGRERFELSTPAVFSIE